MTNISSIIDQFSTIVEAQISGVVQLADPYVIESNTDLMLQNGYGIGVGIARNTERNLGCDRVTIDRTFDIMLLRMIAATEEDTESIETTAKALLEDELKVIKQVEADATLGGFAFRARYEGSESLTYLETERGRYFELITSFGVEYLETTS